MEEITISARQLGLLALPGACPRCHWIHFHTGYQLPWQIFPGIFSSIDTYTKRSIHAYRVQHGQWPVCLHPFDVAGEPVQVPHFTRFSRTDRISGVTLRGTPDEIIRRKDGSYAIVDYKTGRYTDGQDKLLPVYLVQLNAYAWIAKASGFHPVEAAGLVYFEPVTEPEEEVWPARLNHEGFALDFRGLPVRLDLDPDGIIPPLLRKVTDLKTLRNPPPPVVGCQDCTRLDRVLSLILREKKSGS